MRQPEQPCEYTTQYQTFPCNYLQKFIYITVHFNEKNCFLPFDRPIDVDHFATLTKHLQGLRR